MNENLVLLWFVAASVAFGIWPALRLAREGQVGWLIAFGVVAAATFVGWRLEPERVGIISAACLALVVLVPGMLQRRVTRLSNAQDYRGALRTARWAVLLHPDGVYRAQLELLGALVAAQGGDFDRAERALEALVTGGQPALRSLAALYLFRMRGQWREYLELTSAVPRPVLARNPTLLHGRLRALAEIGTLDELIACYREYLPLMAAPGFAQLRASAQLYIAAFAGRGDLAARLLASPLLGVNATARDYWLGIASLTAGDTAAGTRMLERIAGGPDPISARAARRRLALPPTAARLSDAAERALEAIERDMLHEERYGSLANHAGRAWATLALIALNCLGYAVELHFGDPESSRVLFEAGALFRIPGEPTHWADAWRILSALFIHVGFVHLSMNMLGLWVLGPFVERRLGMAKMGVVYFASGLTGSLLTALLPARHPLLFAGASGCIMGVLGATAAIFIDGHYRARSRAASQRLWRIGLVLGLQIVFDSTVPGISVIAHWSGAAVGLLIGYVFVVRAVREPAPAAYAGPTDSPERAT